MKTIKKKGECNFCHSKTIIQNFESEAIPKTDAKWLCRLCSATYGGRVLDFPDQYADERRILYTICKIGNVLLGEMDAMKRQINNLSAQEGGKR